MTYKCETSRNHHHGLSSVNLALYITTQDLPQNYDLSNMSTEFVKKQTKFHWNILYISIKLINHVKWVSLLINHLQSAYIVYIYVLIACNCSLLVPFPVWGCPAWNSWQSLYCFVSKLVQHALPLTPTLHHRATHSQNLSKNKFSELPLNHLSTQSKIAALISRVDNTNHAISKTPPCHPELHPLSSRTPPFVIPNECEGSHTKRSRRDPSHSFGMTEGIHSGWEDRNAFSTRG